MRQKSHRRRVCSLLRPLAKRISATANPSRKAETRAERIVGSAYIRRHCFHVAVFVPSSPTYNRAHDVHLDKRRVRRAASRISRKCLLSAIVGGMTTLAAAAECFDNRCRRRYPPVPPLFRFGVERNKAKLCGRLCLGWLEAWRPATVPTATPAVTRTGTQRGYANLKKTKPKNQWPKKDQWYQLERNKNAPGPDALSLPLSFCTMGPFCRPRFSRHGGHRYLLDTTHEPALSGKTCLRIETSECVCRDVLNNENHFRMAVTGVWTRTLLKTAGCGRLVTGSDLRGSSR